MASKPPKYLVETNQDVRRWYDNMKRSSILNADVRLRRLNLFCDRVGKSPKQLVKLGKSNPMNAENILLDHVSWMEKQNYAPGYIDGVIKSVKAWLVYNHIEIRRKIKIKNIAVTLEDEKVPDHKQLMGIFEAADLRTKVVASLMAFSGTRPQVMGKSDRSDGLVLGDIIDLKVDKDKVEFT